MWLLPRQLAATILSFTLYATILNLAENQSERLSHNKQPFFFIQQRQQWVCGKGSQVCFNLSWQ